VQIRCKSEQLASCSVLGVVEPEPERESARREYATTLCAAVYPADLDLVPVPLLSVAAMLTTIVLSDPG
jgi:hypothetical protein